MNVWKLYGLILLSVMIGCSGSTDETGKTNETEVETKYDPMTDKGIGPISSMDLPATIDPALAVEGDTLFVNKCTACHKVYERKIGPPVAGVTKNRSPEWIMNMILNPEEMVMKNEAAKQLLMEYIAPMANQSLTEHEARAILEYFRSIDAEQIQNNN